MVKAEISLSRKGLLRGFSLTGHAQNRDGASIPCAAVSVLSRTFVHLLELEEGIKIEGAADKPGQLDLRIQEVPPNKEEFFKAATSFLLLGLREAAGEYPSDIELKIISETDKE